MNLTRFLFFPLILLAITGCTKTTSIRHTAEYKKSIGATREILVLPPVAEVNMVNATGSKERMYEYEYHIEDLISQKIVSAIQAKGLRVRLLKKQDIKEQKLYNYVILLRNDYNSIREELYLPHLWEEKKAFSIDKKVTKGLADLQQKTGSDIIMIVDYAGAVKTNGARMLGFALSLLPYNAQAANNTDNSVMVIGIIDAKTGSVLWTNMSMDQKSLYSSAIDSFSSQKNVDTQRVNGLISTALKPLGMPL